MNCTSIGVGRQRFIDEMVLYNQLLIGKTSEVSDGLTPHMIINDVEEHVDADHDGVAMIWSKPIKRTHVEFGVVAQSLTRRRNRCFAEVHSFDTQSKVSHSSSEEAIATTCVEGELA